jgi:hypothetical protein
MMMNDRWTRDAGGAVSRLRKSDESALAGAWSGDVPE